MGWFQPVHAKSIGSQEIRALLVARKQLLGRLLDVELSIRGILRGFGLKVGQVTRKTFEARIRELVTVKTPKSICIGPAWPDMANKNDWQSNIGVNS
jgi:transposase